MGHPHLVAWTVASTVAWAACVLVGCGVPSRDAPSPAARGAATADAPPGGRSSGPGHARGASSSAAEPREPGPAAPLAAGSDGRVRFLAVGDLLLTRRVERAITSKGDPSWPFRELTAVLGAVDFTFANLESPLKPDTPLEGLLAARLLALNLANNHIMDGGLEGLLRTRERLTEAGIQTTGVGHDLERAWEPAIVTVRGVTIGFLGASYTSKNSSRLVRLPYVARIDQRSELRGALRSLRKKVDFMVATMHAGTEYIRFPVAEQIQFAHTAIEHGADLVVGTHPHVVQRVARYRGRYIFYSLGNFVFDQQAPPEVLESAAVRVTLREDDKTLERLEVVPLANPDTLSPQLATEPVARAILTRMGLLEAVLFDANASPAPAAAAP